MGQSWAGFFQEGGLQLIRGLAAGILLAACSKPQAPLPKEQPEKPAASPPPAVQSHAREEEPKAAQASRLALPQHWATLDSAAQAREARRFAESPSGQDWQLLRDIFLDEATPQHARLALFESIRARPNPVKARIFAAAAELPNHPLASECQRLVQLYLGYDPGDAPAAWRKAVEEKLRQESVDRENLLR